MTTGRKVLLVLLAILALLSTAAFDEGCSGHESDGQEMSTGAYHAACDNLCNLDDVGCHQGCDRDYPPK